MRRPGSGHRASFRPYIIVCVMMCLVASLYLVVMYVSPTLATSRAVPSISSSPSAGPAGTVVAVSGSGWFMPPDGTRVTFGFGNSSSCNVVQNAQPGTLDEGSFSGWFRWPASSGLGPFTVCAVFGTNTVIPVNFFNVLSLTPPQISLSTSMLSAGKPVTVTGTNYLPAGSPVQLRWQSVNGGNSITLASVTSDNNGAFTSTFTVPANTQPGAYMLSASVSSGMAGLPPTLSASASFHINSPTSPPGMTPTPNPTPTPRPTATPTVTVTPAATPKATGATATPGAAQTPATGQGGQGNQTGQGNQSGQTSTTRSTGGTTGNTGGFSGSKTLFTIAGMAGLLIGATVLGVTLLVRRKRGAGGTRGTGRAQRATLQAGTQYAALDDFSWQQGSFAAQGAGYPPAYSGQRGMGMDQQAMAPLAEWATVPVADAQMMPEPAMVGARQGSAITGVMTNGSPDPAVAALPTQQFAQFTYQQPQPASVAGAIDTAFDQASLIQSDPALEAVRRQAQVGLFATPRKF